MPKRWRQAGYVQGCDKQEQRCYRMNKHSSRLCCIHESRTFMRAGFQISNSRLIAPMAGLCLLIPASASANGAMSLALATFAWTPWLVYVAVTVLFEAAAMGRWMGIPFVHALRYSLGANFVTAVIGGFFSGIISYMFLGMFGSTLNPNPFGQTLVVFTLFGIGSACIESWVYGRTDMEWPGQAHDRRQRTGVSMNRP